MESLIPENLISNGTNTKNKNSTHEFEMIAVHPTCYTSLRDIISTTSMSTAGVATPPLPSSRKNSWDDIPIKNPLVKHAALAYLQPMSTRPEIDDRSWVERMKENMSRWFFTGHREDDDMEVGCLGLLDGVSWLPIKEALGKILRKRDHED